ncbi:MAG: hypothetical protein HUN04_16450 [Desulfobacter sp.]|nr:MAG: hypothetical protein HUN04_16450 [Desulfobacter sp.]
MSEEKTVIKDKQDTAFLLELWYMLRPYTLCLLKDFFISTGLWTLLWLFKKYTNTATIEGWPGEFITNLHAAGTVIAYGLFIGLLCWDIIAIHREKHD